MADKSPDDRAASLAERIMGRDSTNDAVQSIISGASVTDRDRTEEDGPQPKRKIKSRQQDDEEQNSSIEEDDDETNIDADEADEGDDHQDVVEEDDNADQEEADEEDDSYDEVTYDDHDEIEVVVDGETVVATLSQLKAAFSGEGAIEKRLKEATEERKAARAERDAAVQQIEEHRSNLLRTLSSLDEALFMPLVNKPPASLRVKNMNEYLLQQDAYEEDQKRIAQSRQTMTAFFHQQQEEQQAVRQAYRAQQQELLVERMPELKNPKLASQVHADIMTAANYYGFSKEQVAEVDNHGLFLMARDAARWLNLQKLKNDKKPTSGTVLKRKKRLRSGGVASAKSKAVMSDKQRKVVTNRARESGKVEDVAALLVSNARSRGDPNGRSSRNR